MNTQRRCGRMSKTTENWLNAAVFGHMEHYSISNVPPTELFAHQQICITYLKERLSQGSAQWSYCLFIMMHSILSITQLYKLPIRANKTPHCQETPQPMGVLSHTTMEIYVFITMTHDFSNIFIVELCRSLVVFFSIWQIFPVWFHCAMFQRLCCFRLTTELKIDFQT